MDNLYTSQRDENRKNNRPFCSEFEPDVDFTLRRTVRDVLPVTDFSNNYIEPNPVYSDEVAPSTDIAAEREAERQAEKTNADLLVRQQEIFETERQAAAAAAVAPTEEEGREAAAAVREESLIAAEETERKRQAEETARRNANDQANAQIADEAARRQADIDEANRRAAEDYNRRIAEEAAMAANREEQRVRSLLVDQGVDKAKATQYAKEASKEVKETYISNNTVTVKETKTSDTSGVKTSDEDIFDMIAKWIIKTLNL